MPDVPFILGSKRPAINVIHEKGQYAVQLGSADGTRFHGNILPKPMDRIPQGITPEEIAEAELDALKDYLSIVAFVNGKPYTTVRQ